MPTNLYGPNDNFDLNSSHVLPALIRKFDDATKSQSNVTLWGTGLPKREFLHVDDLAQAVLLLLEKYDGDNHINVGSGEEVTIKQLANLIAELTGYQGEIKWDQSKPDGTPRKILDSSKINSLGWRPKIALREGISSTLNWYRKQR